jgi:UDP-glucose 4-epimerase
MLTQLMQGGEVVVRGSLDRVRDLIYVDEAARAIAGCALDPATRAQIINVGTGTGFAVRALIEELASLLGQRPEEMKIREVAGTVGDPHYSVADISRLAALGLAPRSGARDGLAALVRQRLVAA